jgi:hypothetical protein
VAPARVLAAVELQAAGLRFQEAQDQAEERCLAGAGRADDRHVATPRDREAHAVHGRLGVRAVRRDNVVQREDRRVRPRSGGGRLDLRLDLDRVHLADAPRGHQARLQLRDLL